MVGAAAVGVLLPFPFYCALWNHPQRWVDLCGRGADPCRRMAQVSHVLKALQLLSLASVASFSWPPPLCSLVLLAFGQYLNFKVYQLLGESGTYYGVRFGKKIPWVTGFPFGYIKDPQYVGSMLSLVALLCWVPFQYCAALVSWLCFHYVGGVQRRSCHSCKAALLILLVVVANNSKFLPLSCLLLGGVSVTTTRLDLRKRCGMFLPERDEQPFYHISELCSIIPCNPVLHELELMEHGRKFSICAISHSIILPFPSLIISSQWEAVVGPSIVFTNSTI